MKRTWLISIYVTSLIATMEVNALSPQKNNCKALPGLWFGTTTLKHEKDCRKAGGCSQILSVDIKALPNAAYQFDLSPPVVGYRSIKATCENNQLQLPLNSPYEVSLTCQEGSACRLLFNNARIGATASKISD